MTEAIDYAVDAGVYVVFAAGNDADNGNWYPGAYEPVIAVAAAQNSGVAASFTNYGGYRAARHMHTFYHCIMVLRTLGVAARATDNLGSVASDRGSLTLLPLAPLLHYSNQVTGSISPLLA